MKDNKSQWPRNFTIFNLMTLVGGSILGYYSGLFMLNRWFFSQMGMMLVGYVSLSFNQQDLILKKPLLWGVNMVLSVISIVAIHFSGLEQLLFIFLPFAYLFVVKYLDSAFSWSDVWAVYNNYLVKGKGWVVYLRALFLRLVLATFIIAVCASFGMVELYGMAFVSLHIVPMMILGLVAAASFMIFDALCEPQCMLKHELSLYTVIPVIYSAWSIVAIFCKLPHYAGVLAALAGIFYYQRDQEHPENFVYQIVSVQILFLSLVSVQATPLIEVLLCAAQVVLNIISSPTGGQSMSQRQSAKTKKPRRSMNEVNDFQPSSIHASRIIKLRKAQPLSLREKVKVVLASPVKRRRQVLRELDKNYQSDDGLSMN